MEKEIDRLTKTSTSLDQVMTLSKCKRFIKYSDIKKMNDWRQLFNGSDCVIMLIETEPNNGHWVALLKRGNIIEFFDSYGILLDDQRNFIPYENRKMLGSDYNYLTRLLYNSGMRIEYNDHPFQSENPDIATCGLWVAWRILNKGLSIENFIRKFKKKTDRDIVLQSYDFSDLK